LKEPVTGIVMVRHAILPPETELRQKNGKTERQGELHLQTITDQLLVVIVTYVTLYFVGFTGL
jgi:hypothetical protein